MRLYANSISGGIPAGRLPVAIASTMAGLTPFCKAAALCEFHSYCAIQ